jgi:hypothetical protein
MIRSRSSLTRPRLPANPLRAYAQRLGRLWWLVGLTMLAAGAVAALTDAVQPPTSQAGAVLVLRPAPGLPVGTDRVRLIEHLDQAYLPNTILKALFSPDSLDVLAAQAGLSPAAAADYTFTNTIDPANNTIHLTCSGPDATRAAAYLNAVADGATVVTQRIYRLISVQVLDRPTTPAPVIRPDPAHDVPLAMGLGLVLGLLLAVLLDYLAE